MFLTAALTGLAVFLSGFILLFIVRSVYEREKRAFLFMLRAYFESQEPGEKSQFAAFIDILSETFAQKMVMTLKTTFMGMQSVDRRNEQRLETDLVKDMASQENPLIGALLNQFPAVARRIAKNPELMGLAMNMLANKGKAAAAITGGGNNDFASRLHNYGG